MQFWKVISLSAGQETPATRPYHDPQESTSEFQALLLS
jgi:hypothetical protein